MLTLAAAALLAADPLPPWDFDSPDFDADWPQITVEIRTVTADKDLLAAAGVQWTSGRVVTPAGVVAETTSDPRERGVLSATSVGLRDAVAVSAVVDDSVIAEVIGAAQADERANLRFAPKVTVFQGATATVTESVVRPLEASFTFSEEPSGDGVGDVVMDGIEFEIVTDREDAEWFAATVRAQDYLGESPVVMPAGLPSPLKRPDVKRMEFSVRERIPAGKTLVCGVRGGTAWTFTLFTTRVISMADIAE